MYFLVDSVLNVCQSVLTCGQLISLCHRLQQRGVAEVVGHHDGGVQGREIEGGDGVAVVTLDRLDDCRAQEVFTHFGLHGGDDIVVLDGLEEGEISVLKWLNYIVFNQLHHKEEMR